MSKISDFYTRFPPPPTGAQAGSWQYVEHNPAPMWVEDEPQRRTDWVERREWAVAAAAITAAVIALVGLFVG